MNAEFVDTELPSESDLVGLVSGAENSSFIGAVGLQHKNTKVVVSCDHAGTLSSEFASHPYPSPSENCAILL